ncbi:hypothetical protein [Acidisphaera rubrifaciens]|uniref:Uncharacterized protein n=1 Tax=Acidisphaera rubrifaciens HS-AP3 TaxID=1231350 RepID=A0A0D6P7F1_9PROT|nr:hypothetical protein [Acidisphaera rubrifaciens]GAN77271.1 hypothetical protein Asru_0272_02 [Acidisphaera rubrifaciens HS-AP3]
MAEPLTEPRVLLLALDTAAPTLDVAALAGVLAADRRIAAWWNHLPGVFLLATRVPPSDIADLVRATAGGAGFLVTEIDLARTDGWLTDTAWHWIGRHAAAPRAIPAPPAPSDPD